MRFNLRDLINTLEPTEREALLICSILERGNDPVSPIIEIVKAVRVLAQYLDIKDRILIAERLRDAADECEHRQRVAVN